ncbi:MAG: hypothetical protein CAF45_005270 [Nitrospira sp. CG24E]|nr:MAG: hypothetical protein CAF45_005270 [Nitrospira sp. CG24E]
MSSSHWFRHWRGRRSIRFLGVVVALCLLAALATFGVRSLMTSVGSAKHIRYEPVDVPPLDISPSHQRERDEYERRERVVTEKSR